MTTLRFGEATGKYLIPKLESIINDINDDPEIDKTIEKPVRAMILGGYALQGICSRYDIDIARKTKDIDLYSADARGLGENICPTGARIQLTNDFHAELFDWISGMDHEKDLQKRIDLGMQKNKLHTVYRSENIELYLPSPEIFVANKLFAYRGNTSRKKDLNDVKKIVGVLKSAKQKYIIEKIGNLVKRYGLDAEYKLALSAR